MLKLDLIVTKDENNNGMCVCLRPQTSVLLSPKLVHELRELQNSLADKILSNSLDHYYYVIWYLEHINKRCWSGLAYNFIVDCIKNRSEIEFEKYIDEVFNFIFLNYIGLGLPVINCSIITHDLTGISKDFFLLNKLCFIHDSNAHGINQIDVKKQVSKLVFDPALYEKNSYFCYESMQIDKIRTIIEKAHYEIPSSQEIIAIKKQFDRLKDETIETIYSLASKDIRILERLARLRGWSDM